MAGFAAGIQTDEICNLLIYDIVFLCFPTFIKGNQMRYSKAVYYRFILFKIASNAAISTGLTRW